MEIKNNLRLQKRIVEFRNKKIMINEVIEMKNIFEHRFSIVSISILSSYFVASSLEYMSCKIAASNINCKNTNIWKYLRFIRYIFLNNMPYI